VDAAGQLPLSFDMTERPRHAVGLTAEYSADLGASAGVTFQRRNLFGRAEQLNLGAAVTQLGGSASRGSGYKGSTQHSRRQLQSSMGQPAKTRGYVESPEDRKGRVRLGRF